MNVETDQIACDDDLTARRARRERVWNEIRARAHQRGISEDELQRFRSYLSVNLKLDEPSYVDRMQRPRNYFPGLEALPVHETSKFPWALEIEEKFDTIRDELFRHSSSLTLDVHPQDLADKGKWSVLYFFAGGMQTEVTRQACPTITKILDRVAGTGQAGNTYLSVLQGGTHIQQHFGPTNARLRCHVGLSVPEGAKIRIGEDIYRWRDGKCLVFDDAYEHEVWNDSDRDRSVLIIDFWHPGMTEAECWAMVEARAMPDGLVDFSPDSSTVRAVSATV